MELTIQQACAHSADFMYLWADEEKFLRYIKAKYANEIRRKKANQKKLILLSAKKYGKTYDDYTSAIRSAFIEQWDGHTPAEALVILAQGGKIAGKNWEEGVYGIGAVRNNFNGITVDDKAITVDPTTGHILWGTEDITDESKTVYDTIKGEVIPFQLFSKNVSGITYTFMSQYNKTAKKYQAQSYADGQYTYSAKNGSEITATDNADIWGSIQLSLQTFIDWLISLFGGENTKEQISASNTLPSQTADGFVSAGDGGIVEAGGGILLALAAAGLIVSGMKKKKK